MFIDEGITGKTHRRAGFQSLMAAIAAGEIDTVIVFSTNRLFRKRYKTLQFVEEEILDRRLRCVFIKTGIDTSDKERWRQLLHVHSMVDEVVVTMTVGHIRASHVGQLRLGLVFGTLTYGFSGEPIPGQFTRLGRPTRRLIIDPATARWVQQIFEWFVVDRLSIRAIVRRLNAQNAPLPERSLSKRWTYRVVRRILENERYRGRWGYGETEVVWQNKAGYGRQFKRETPLAEQTFEPLRIIPEDRWLESQRLLADYRSRGGRHPKDGDRKSRPKILNKYLFCQYHPQQRLHVCGSHGDKMTCPVCVEGKDRHLFNALPRVAATRAVLGTIGRLASQDADLATQAIAACVRHAQGLQQPDLGDLDAKKQREASLTRAIDFILNSPGETEEDQAENQAKLAEHRRQRAGLRAQIQQIEHALAAHVSVPTETQVRELIEKLEQVLIEVADSDEPEVTGRAERIVEIATGGRILVSQQGEPGTRRGWLRLSFTVDVLKLLMAELGAPAAAGKPVELNLDIRILSPREALADEVKALWDQDLLVKAIAAKLSAEHGRKIGRNLVTLALNEWFTSRGLPVPDGRSRRATLKTKHMDPTLYDRMAEAVLRLFNEGLLYSEIAERLDLDRNTVTAIVKRWHEERNLAVPDGRTRRKGLDHKERPGGGSLKKAG